MKKKLFRQLKKYVKDMRAVMRGDIYPAATTVYRTLEDGSVLRIRTLYDQKTGRDLRTETDHLVK